MTGHGLSLEEELRQQLSYELSGIEGMTEVWLEALDKQDPSVILGHTPSPAEQERILMQMQWAILNFSREAIFRLAGEIDELRAAGDGGDDLG